MLRLNCKKVTLAAFGCHRYYEDKIYTQSCLKTPITSVCLTIWMHLNLFNFDGLNFELSPHFSSGEDC